MSIQVKELTLREFTRAQIDLYSQKGDFSDLSGLIPSRITPPRLERFPAWSSYVTFGDFSDCEGAVFHHSNKIIVMLGTDNDGDLAAAYCNVKDWTLAAISDLSAATGLQGLGGHRGRNAIWFEDTLYLIGDDDTIYSTADYAGSLAQFSANAFTCLCVYGDRFYAARTNGSIERLNDAGNAMEAHWTATNADMLWDFLTGYRGYIYGVATCRDGRRVVVQVDSAEATTPSFQVMAELHDAGIEHPRGCTYAQHGNYIYFIPGIHTTYALVDASEPAEPAYAPVYRHRLSSAHSLELVGTIETDPANYFYVLPWRGHLLVAEIDEHESATLKFHTVHDDGGVSTGAPLSADTGGLDTFAYSSHGFLVVTGTSGADEGFYHLGPDTGFQDGYLVTSKLDMDYPGKVKRLDTITVILDNAETDFKVVVKYRVDEETSWTTATTGNNERHVTISALGTAFYTLQIRVDLDDDSGNHADYRINAISAIYTVDT